MKQYTAQNIFISLALLALFYVLMIDPAFAQNVGTSAGLKCDGGKASGALYHSGNVKSCPAVMSFNNIFSFLICNMEELSSNLLGSMFCGVVSDLTPAFMAVVTLAVVFQSISFTLGLNPRSSARDLQFFLLKISVITAFATQADYLIGIGYNFFVTSMRDGVAVVLSAVVPGGAGTSTSGVQLYGMLDKFLGTAIGYVTQNIGYKATAKPAEFCTNAVFAAMAIMAVAFPPMAYLGLLLIFRIGITFLRAVFGYIYAIVGIAFLMVLSPFFLAFALFRQTQQFFEKWVGYMVSFTLQMVLMFSFLTFVLSINVSHITASLPKIVVPNEDKQETTAFRMPWDYCTLCEFKVFKADADGNATAEEIKPDKDGHYKDLISQGVLQCEKDKDGKPKPISVLNAAGPGGAGLKPEEQKKLLNTLLTFTAVGLLSLLILAYVVEELLALVPSLAQTLAGGYGQATYAPQIGGGWSPTGRTATTLPFESLGKEIVGSDGSGDTLGTFGRGLASKGNAVSGTVQGVKDSVLGLVNGRDSKGRGTGPGGSDGGISNLITDFVSDPNRIDEG